MHIHILFYIYALPYRPYPPRADGHPSRAAERWSGGCSPGPGWNPHLARERDGTNCVLFKVIFIFIIILWTGIPGRRNCQASGSTVSFQRVLLWLRGFKDPPLSTTYFVGDGDACTRRPKQDAAMLNKKRLHVYNILSYLF